MATKKKRNRHKKARKDTKKKIERLTDVIGDWMGSQYDASGHRWDYHLFLDHDGRYERTIRREPDYEQCDAGRWRYEKESNALCLEPDPPGVPDSTTTEYWVLSVTTCEQSNVLLVLRPAILAARNLPILLYRVHCSGRGYGTGWEERLTNRPS